MEKVFKKYANQEIAFKDYSAFVAGFNDHHIILATREEPVAKFKKLDKVSFILDEYKNEVFNYIYTSEKTLENYLKSGVVNL